jgi:hypothetical protein
MSSLRRLASIVAVLLFTSWTGVVDLVAQQATATFEISVSAADSESPLVGATVLVEGLGMRGVTDQNGNLRITGLAPGTRRIEVRYLGYAPLEEVVVFSPGRVTRVNALLWSQPIQLAEVRVRARRSILVSRGFFERQRAGQGTFFTRDQIEATRPRHLSDLLRTVSGFQVGTSTFGARPPTSIRGSSVGSRCPIQFFVDGTLTAGFHIDDVQPGDVEGLEIYRGAATVPSTFNRGTAGCGVIVIWTRIE